LVGAGGGGGDVTGGGYPATNYGGGGQGGALKFNVGYHPNLGGSGYQGCVIISYEWPVQLGTGGDVTQSGNTFYHVITSSTQKFSW
jgi:hypothetical protein